MQIISKAGGQIILDAGTGIRVLAEKNPLAPNKKYTILLSHLHWDHIQGFPFFSPIFNPEASFDIYSPFPNMAESLARQMRPPFFPVEFSAVKQRMNFHVISPGVEFEIEGVKVNCCKMCHPGASYSYSIREGAKKFVYGTDMELYLESHFHDPLVKTVFKNADAAATEYGDPDNNGDLKRYNQVYLRAEAWIGWAILDGSAFARIETASSGS